MSISDFLEEAFDAAGELFNDTVDKIKDLGDNLSDWKDDAIDLIDDVANSNAVGLITGLASGRIMNEAIEEQVNKDIERLNKVNDENNKIVKETNEMIEKTKESYQSCMQKMIYQREEVFSKILRPYCEYMKHLISDSRFTNSQKNGVSSTIEIHKINNVDYSRGEYNGHSMFHILTRTTGIAFVMGIRTSVNIEYKIEKAKEEKARLESEKAQIEVKCTSIREVVEFLNSSYDVVEKLKCEAEKYINELKNLIMKKGRYCSNFSNQDINMLKNSLNLIILLNNIVNTNLVTEEGIINPVYKKYIQQELNEENYN